MSYKKILGAFLLLLLTAHVCLAGEIKPSRGMVISRGHPLTRGLVGYWLMNEGTSNKVFDLSGHGNHGTFVGGTSWTSANFGHGLRFDGTGDYINCGSNSSVLSDAWTVAAWVKTDNTEQNMLCGWGSNSACVYLHFGSSGQPLIFLGGYAYFNSGGWDKIKDGNWHHVVFSMPGPASTDLNKAEMYVDGQPIDRGSVVSQTQSTKTSFYIAESGVGRDFDGDMSCFAYYNRELSASEVSQLYKEPFCMFYTSNTPIRQQVIATGGGGGSVPIYRRRRN